MPNRCRGCTPRSHRGNSERLHVFVGTEPPPELIAAARRGECVVAHGDGPKDVPRWAKALARLAEHLIEDEHTESDATEIVASGSQPNLNRKEAG